MGHSSSVVSFPVGQRAGRHPGEGWVVQARRATTWGRENEAPLIQSALSMLTFMFQIQLSHHERASALELRTFAAS